MGVTREPMEVAQAFGGRVRQRRMQLGWSLEKLAEHSGLHWTYVGSVERGERNVSLLNICRLALALDTDPGVLMQGLRP